jgi:Uma2 family endonuclease
MTTLLTSPPKTTPEREDDPEHDPKWFRLRSVDWETYVAISEALTGRHVRLTYDRGTLEFMTISSTHSRLSRVLVLFVFVLAEELKIKMLPCGDMTMRREDLERGIEADESFYVANEPLVRDKPRIDLACDPPPDLAVEVDISRSSRHRMPIYQAIAVPEVWRLEGEAVAIHVRGPDGLYMVAERSLAFPFVTAADLTRFVGQPGQHDVMALVEAFREWVREQIARGAAK